MMKQLREDGMRREEKIDSNNQQAIYLNKFSLNEKCIYYLAYWKMSQILRNVNDFEVASLSH